MASKVEEAAVAASQLHPASHTLPMLDSPREECGVFGVYARGERVAQLTFFGLCALQHRGQESAGIATTDGRAIYLHKQMGFVAHIFDEETLRPLVGHSAIGHTRYSTTGTSKLLNAQPIVVESPLEPCAVCHNGNLTNARQLRDMVLARGATLTTGSDTEIAARCLSGAPGQTWSRRIAHFLATAEGAYCLIILTHKALYAVRDPWGLRPLCIGRLGPRGWVVASETCALDAVGAQFIRGVAPGEAIRVDDRGFERIAYHPAPRRAFCLFEYIYFGRPDSVLQGQVIHGVRMEMGRALAREAPAEADLVVGVPDSAIPAALGYAQESGTPYGEGMVKNNYVGRTFIKPDQRSREQSISLKLNPLPSALSNQRVVLVDDSLVRGTTSSQIVRLLYKAGAKEVHMRIASPPIKHPCYMGVDMGTYAELIAHRLSVEELCAHLGATSLAFLSYEGLIGAIGRSAHNFCAACFTGTYPFPIRGQQTKDSFEEPAKVALAGVLAGGGEQKL